MKKRLLSAVQPSGNIHIGNYLGAIKNWVMLQNEYECFFPVVDLHAITVHQDPKELKQNIRQVAALYIACGINPKQSTIFVQSHIPAHSELAWILSCHTQIGELKRMTQFKDKTNEQKAENISAGLFFYPTLMAADILLYETDVVPVGEDQAQHVEITRDIAKRFNNRFNNVFAIPQSLINRSAARIMALDDPSSKMAKSAKSEYNFIALLDSKEEIRKKIARAVTDSQSSIACDPEKRPGLANLLNIYSLFAEKKIEDIVKTYKNKDYAEFKKDLADLLVKKLAPIREKTEKLLESNELEKVLEEGAKKANIEAEKTLKTVKEKLGLG